MSEEMISPAEKPAPTPREIAAAMKRGSKLPKNIKISIAFHTKIEKKIKLLFRYIFTDYFSRLGLLPVDTPTHIAIAGIDPSTNPNPQMGVTINGTERILMQVEDPFLDIEEGKENEVHIYVKLKFLENVCHEMVHVCQMLVADEDCKPKWHYISHNRKDEEEAYFFDKAEIQARIFEVFYSHKYAMPLFFDSDSDNLILKD